MNSWRTQTVVLAAWRHATALRIFRTYCGTYSLNYESAIQLSHTRTMKAELRKSPDSFHSWGVGLAITALPNVSGGWLICERFANHRLITGRRNGEGYDSSQVTDELAKLARRDRQHFDCATWLHKAREFSKEDFQQAVERELSGKLTEPWEIVYFKLYESQTAVIERAIETAALMLGSDRSRGYCLEMICADFLAGANLDHGDPEMLLFAMRRFFKFLPEEQQQAFLEDVSEKAL